MATGIRHNDSCNQHISKLFNNDLFSDVVLVVNEKRFHAHKNILAIRSDYFSSLFSSGLSESTQPEIEIKEVNTDLFEKLLRYIYTGELDFNQMETEKIDLLIMANKYLFKDLESDIAKHLTNILTPENFVLIYSAARMCSIQSMMDDCLKFADIKCNDLLKSPGFSDLQVGTVEEILSRRNFKPDHTVLFTAISKWIEVNGREHAGPLLSKIRLPDLPLGFLVNTVRPSGLFSESDILNAISAMEHMSAGPAQNSAMRITLRIECRTNNSQSRQTLEVMSSDSVAVVKERIGSSLTCCSRSTNGCLRLEVGGTVLQEHCSLNDYNIQSRYAIDVIHYYQI